MPVVPDAAPIAAPVIITATMGVRDFAWADSFRRAHFPPDRNVLRAHITLFHHLPPERLPELSRLLQEATRGAPAPAARLCDVMLLGGGVAFRIESPELLAIRAWIAEWFANDLLPQDQHTPRLHITIQNKVSREEARTLHAGLAATFRARPIAIAGLAAWHYLGGPWQLVREYKFASARS